MPALYTIGRYTVAPALRIGWRPRVEGIEHIPASGGVLIAGNHLSVADEYFLGAVVPRHIAFWAKSDYFKGTGITGWLSRSFMHGLGAIPVERAGGRAVLSAFDAAIPALRSGEIVCVFPEGTRSPDGRLYRGRTGVARLSLGAGVPVVPVGFVGTERIQPIGAWLPRPRWFGSGDDLVVRFGKPMDFTGRPADRSGLRAITDEIMTEIRKLSGQEYVARYAPPRPSNSDS